MPKSDVPYKLVVNSSNIQGEYYNERTQELYIKFKRSDAEYKYSEVTPEEYKSLFEKGTTLGKKLHEVIIGKKETEKL